MKKLMFGIIVVALTGSAFADVGHYSYGDNTNAYARLLRSAMSQEETGLQQINEVLGTMAQMIDGDGSSPTQFTYLAAKFGFPDNATAFAAWNELNSMASKLNTDASETNVHAALIQAFNKFR